MTGEYLRRILLMSFCNQVFAEYNAGPVGSTSLGTPFDSLSSTVPATESFSSSFSPSSFPPMAVDPMTLAAAINAEGIWLLSFCPAVMLPDRTRSSLTTLVSKLRMLRLLEPFKSLPLVIPRVVGGGPDVLRELDNTADESSLSLTLLSPSAVFLASSHKASTSRSYVNSSMTSPCPQVSSSYSSSSLWNMMRSIFRHRRRLLGCNKR